MSHTVTDSPSRAWGVSLLVVVIGAFMAILDSSIVNIAIPTIMAEFGASASEAQWVITVYLLTLGVVVPSTGWLGDRLGLRRLYIASLVVFVAGSALCAFSWSVSSLIAFRILQGIGGGVIMPVTMAMVYRMVPRDRIGTAMGILGLAIVLGPAVGPTLGGYLVEYVNWRFIFTINIPIGILGALAASVVLPAFTHDGPVGDFDAVGFVTSAVGLFTLLLALSEVGTYGWTSEYIVVLLTISAASLGLFVYAELTHPAPLLDLRVFRYREFTLSSILVAITTVGLFAGIFYIPLFLQTVVGLGAFQTGLVLLPSALVTGLLMPVSGRLYDRIGARPLALVGTVVLTLTTFLLHRLAVDTPPTTVLWWMVGRAFGMGLLMMPVTTAGMAVVPTEKINRASAVSNIIQRVSGSFGLAALTSYLTGREAAHAAVAAASVNAANLTATRTLEGLALLLHQPLPSVFQGGGPANMLLGVAAQQQAFVQGADELFVVAALLVACGFVPALFLRHHRAAQASGRLPMAAD